MKIKLTVIPALIFIMCALFFHAELRAAQEIAPPAVTASITGNALRIETEEGFFGVEAVYINEKRFNYRVDGVLIVDARDYAGDGKLASVYAVDFAGNKSNTVWLDNPFYIAPSEPPPETPPPKPFTPDGQATVQDHAAESDGKDFYTFTTQAGSVFHLIIDHQRNNENVYFLNAITESDLMAVAEKSDKTGISAIPEPTPKPVPVPVETEKPPEAGTPPAPKSNNGAMILVIIAVLAFGGAAYYIKIVKPRQQGADAEENEENEAGDSPEYDNEDDEPDEDSGDGAE